MGQMVVEVLVVRDLGDKFGSSYDDQVIHAIFGASSNRGLSMRSRGLKTYRGVFADGQAVSLLMLISRCEKSDMEQSSWTTQENFDCSVY